MNPLLKLNLPQNPSQYQNLAQSQRPSQLSHLLNQNQYQSLSLNLLQNQLSHLLSQNLNQSHCPYQNQRQNQNRYQNQSPATPPILPSRL